MNDVNIDGKTLIMSNDSRRKAIQQRTQDFRYKSAFCSENVLFFCASFFYILFFCASFFYSVLQRSRTRIFVFNYEGSSYEFSFCKGVPEFNGTGGKTTPY